MSDQVQPLAVAADLLSNAQNAGADGQMVSMRGNRRGELFVQALNAGKMFGQAREGSYFVTVNPTQATAVAGHVAAVAYDAAKPTMVIKNTGLKTIELDVLDLMLVTPGTNSTDIRVSMYLDPADRTPASGSLLVPANVNTEAANTTGASIRFGAVTAAAAGSDARRIFDKLVRSILPITLDVFRFVFGSAGGVAGPQGIDLATKATILVPCPPVVIGPGRTFLFHVQSAAQTVAATWEHSLGYIER